MSKMVKLFKEHCVLLLSIGLMVSGFIYLFYQMITVVIENVNQTTCFLLFKKITYGLIKYSNITEYKYIDVIICYFEIFNLCCNEGIGCNCFWNYSCNY